MIRANIFSTALLSCMLAAPVFAADSDERSFLHAESILREGKNKEARQAFWRVVDGYPDSSLADDALYRLATMDFDVKEIDELTRGHAYGADAAFPLLENIRTDYGDSDRAADARYLQGLAHMVPGSKLYDLDRAFAAFREVVDVHPYSAATPAALRATATVELRAGHPGRALLYLERLLLQHPGHPETRQARLDAADAYLRLGLVREALVRLAPLQARNGPEAEAALDLATLLATLDLSGPAGLRPPVALRDFAPANNPLRNASDMIVDRDGRLHVVVDGGKKIVRLDTKGNVTDERAVQGARRLFREPAGAIGWASADALHLSTGTLSPCRTVGNNTRPVNDMAHVAMGADGSFFVMESGGKEVLRLAPDGMFRNVVAQPGRGVDLALDRQGNIYVLDARSREVLVRSADGGDLGTMQLSSHAMRAQTPVALAVDDAYHVYVLDSKTKDILVLGDAGRLLARLHAEPGSPEAVGDPKALAVSNSGAVLVYDARERVIRRFR